MEKPQLKIYFCGSMRGVKSSLSTYKLIVNYLKTKGKVLTEHIVNPSLEKNYTDEEIYNFDYKSFCEADLMVAEVTAPSHGVGIELGWGMKTTNFPILCIAAKIKEYSISALIKGSPFIVYREYEKEEEIYDIIEEFFKNLKFYKE